MTPLMPLEDGIERTVEPTEISTERETPRFPAGWDLVFTPSPRTVEIDTPGMMAQAPAPRGA